MEDHFAKIVSDLRLMGSAPSIHVGTALNVQVVNLSLRMEKHFSWLADELNSLVVNLQNQSSLADHSHSTFPRLRTTRDTMSHQCLQVPTDKCRSLSISPRFSSADGVEHFKQRTPLTHGSTEPSSTLKQPEALPRTLPRIVSGQRLGSVALDEARVNVEDRGLTSHTKVQS